MSADVISFGCRLNLAEGEAIRDAAGSADDLIVVNGCAVTAEAMRQARQAIRRARRQRPEARIVVTGCAAQVDPAMFAAMPEVDRVLGNREKLSPASYPQIPDPFVPSQVEGAVRAKPRTIHGLGFARQDVSTSLDTNGDRVMVSDLTAPTPLHPPAVTHANRTRAFVEVQTGCDHRCTFCIIPYGRGPSRSQPAGAVIDRIKALVDAGCCEVVLTGVDATSYGPDLPGDQRLGSLVERILAHVPALPRLRLSSLDGVEIDDRLFALITGEPRVMPHVHLSLQSGDDMVLKRMKRRHSRAQAVDLVARLKTARREIAIGADLIAGFPTETEEMYGNSLRLIDECDIVLAHIFPYSPRAGTPAARMPQVDPAVARTRAARLREASDARRAAWLAGMVGSVQQVLVERNGRGHGVNFANFRAPELAPGLHDLRVTASDGATLTGVPA